MRQVINAVQKEFKGENLLAAISCMVLSITIYVILNATNHL